MNMSEIVIIGLLCLNLILLILTGRAIIVQIKSESYDLSKLLVDTLTQQLPEVISDLAENAAGMAEVNPIQQLIVEYFRNAMNSPQITAEVTEIPRADNGQFSKLDT